MKLLALISISLIGCTLPAAPEIGPGPGGSQSQANDASVDSPDAGGGEPLPGPDAEARADAQPRSERVLSQTDSNIVEGDASIACVDDDGRPVENSYYRVFDLAAEEIEGSFHVTKVEIGVQIADGGDDGALPIDVRLHTLAPELPLQVQNLGPVATATNDATERSDNRLAFDFDADIRSGSRLVVEVHAPDGRGRGDAFFIGANDDGQSAPSYIRATECEDDPPRDLATVGFPDMHIIIDVTGA